MNKYLLLIVMITFFSCDKPKSIKELIVGDKGFKFWQMVNNESEDSVFYFDYFDKSGKWLPFVSENGKFDKHSTPSDVVRIDEWDLKDDSILVVGGTSISYILKITQDSLIEYNISNKEIQRYITAPDNLLPSKYNIFQ